MNNVDENARTLLEFSVTGIRLTAKTLTAIMNLFLQKDNRKQYYQDMNTKQGKQDLKDLFKKHDNIDIQSLEGNMSKEEKKFYEKEFKDMGVDFSIKKIGKDSYSLFFTSKDMQSIEKGMSNAIEKHSKREKTKAQVKAKVKEKLKFKKPTFNVKDLQEKLFKEKQKQSNKKVKTNSKTKEKVKPLEMGW